MLKIIQDPQDPLLELVKQDPVRPHIPAAQRVGKNAQVLVLMDQQQVPQSVVCVAFNDHIPTDEQQLFDYDQHQPTVAVLYTIWAIEKGAGRAMIAQVQNHIRENWPTVSRLVTLSPLTDMARQFHMRNGARELQVNPQTQNFEYLLT